MLRNQSCQENGKAILTREYEHFDSKENESLTEIYDRFLTLLNELSLVGKEYNLEDTENVVSSALIGLDQCISARDLDTDNQIMYAYVIFTT